MATDLPSASAGPAGAIRLADLRAIVAAADAAGTPDDTIVRGNAIPFRLVDLGNPRGSVLRTLALDDPRTFTPRP